MDTNSLIVFVAYICVLYVTYLICSAFCFIHIFKKLKESSLSIFLFMLYGLNALTNSFLPQSQRVSYMCFFTQLNITFVYPVR